MTLNIFFISQSFVRHSASGQWLSSVSVRTLNRKRAPFVLVFKYIFLTCLVNSSPLSFVTRRRFTSFLYQIKSWPNLAQMCSCPQGGICLCLVTYNSFQNHTELCTSFSNTEAKFKPQTYGVVSTIKLDISISFSSKDNSFI